MRLKYTAARVKKFTSKKLYERLTRLNDEKTPDIESITILLSEIAQRDPEEYEAGKIEAEVEKSKRHTVMETTDILHLDIKYYENYLEKPESETDPYERKIRSAKLEMVQKELARRSK